MREPNIFNLVKFAMKAQPDAEVADIQKLVPPTRDMDSHRVEELMRQAVTRVRTEGAKHTKRARPARPAAPDSRDRQRLAFGRYTIVAGEIKGMGKANIFVGKTRIDHIGRETVESALEAAKSRLVRRMEALGSGLITSNR